MHFDGNFNTCTMNSDASKLKLFLLPKCNLAFPLADETWKVSTISNVSFECHTRRKLLFIDSYVRYILLSPESLLLHFASIQHKKTSLFYKTFPTNMKWGGWRSAREEKVFRTFSLPVNPDEWDQLGVWKNFSQGISTFTHNWGESVVPCDLLDEILPCFNSIRITLTHFCRPEIASSHKFWSTCGESFQLWPILDHN
jgi:hypothetical protein